jgi:formylglycine-generating enzyme required for sulfatase activity
MRNTPEGYFGNGHLVYLSPFLIDRFETTVAEYRECVSAGACDLVPLVSGDTRYMIDELPMVNVTWFDAQTYCRWRHKRLPTEAEWEKAARGSDARRWPWGNADGTHRANRGKVRSDELRPARPGDIDFGPDESDGAKIMAPPGTFRWGKSPYGVYDMSGNVSEWVADWFKESGYSLLPVINPTGVVSGSYRVVRGGDFDAPRLWSRTYFRGNAKPTSRAITRGMRCVRDVP